MPLITVHSQPMVIWSKKAPPRLPGPNVPRWLANFLYWVGERFVMDRVACPVLNRWRSSLGLAPMSKLMRWWQSSYGVLCMFPEWYANQQSDWPKPLLQTDFPLWNHRSQEPLHKDLERFLTGGSAPIAFAPGSANVHGGAFFTSAVQACEKLQERAILLTEFPEQLPPLRSHAMHVHYAPLDRVLPRCKAIVHHGGIGTTSQAMLAGVPQLIRAMAHDQFDNADRVKRLGLGLGLPTKRFTTRRLIDKLRLILESKEIGANTKSIAERMSPRDGLSRSALAIEELARRP
jgi:rhamnosyltransferase subunit B